MDLAKLRQQIPQLDGLTDDQAVDAIHEAYYPDLSRDAVAQRLGIKPPPAPEKRRTWGEAASDTGRGVMSGLAGLVKTVGDVYGVATGDFDNTASELGGNAQQYWHDGQSQALNNARQRRSSAIQASDGILGKAATAISETVTDPTLLADTISENASTMLAPLAAAKAVQAARLAQLARTGVVAEQAAASAAKAATTAAIATGAVQQGADVASNAYDQALKTTAQDLQQNPDYVQRVQSGEDPAAVLRDLASKAGQAAFLPATAVSVASQFIPGSNAAERALIGGLAKVPAKNAIAGAVKGLVGEGTQEAIEEGGGQYAANATNKAYVNPNQDMSQDVGMNAGLGAVGGMALGGVGGVFHGDHGHTPSPSPLQAPPQVPDNGPLSRAANSALETMHREARTLALPAPSIQVSPGGTAFTTEQRNSLMQGVMGDREGGIVDVTPIPQQTGGPVKAFQGPQEQIDQSLANIEMWGKRARPVPLETAQDYKAQFAEQGKDLTVIPHPAGQGFTVVPSAWVAPFMRSQAQQAPLSGMLPAPDMPAPDAPLVSDAGAVRPQTYGDQAASRATAESWKEEAERKAAIGLTPDVERAQRTRAMAIIQPGDITTPKGTPFRNMMAVKKAAKKAPGEILEVRGGWVIRPAAQDAKVKDGNTGGTSGLLDDAGVERAPDSGSGVDRLGGNTAVRGGAELHPDGNAAGGSGESADRTGVVDNGRAGGLVDGSVTEKRPLKKVADVYGSTHYVDARELASDTTMLKRYRQDGVPISTEGKTRLHRDNIDIDGSKAKNAWKDLPALDNSGKGFGNSEAVVRAIKRMKQDVDAFDIKQHDGSGRWHAVRKQPSIKGDAIDKDWAAFTPESGTLGIPRADMPQIKAEHRGAMVNFLNARGVEHEQDDVPARSLKPTQAEFSPEKVQKAKEFSGGDRSILVSEDGHVVDGHHQWLAKHDAGESVKVIRLKAPIKDLIDTVKAFPSAEQQDGSSNSDEANAVPDSRDATGKQASWVIREKSNGKAVMETFDKKVAGSINTEKYEAVPIADHLASLSNGAKETGASTSTAAADYSKRSVDWLRQNGGESITVKEAVDALVTKQRAIMEDQKNWTPRDSSGHPVSGVNLYTSDAVQKLDKIAWAIANLMDHQKKHGEGKAEQPAEPTKKTEPLSKTVEKVNAKHGEGLTEADRVPEQKPASKTPRLDQHNALFAAAREGSADASTFKSAFSELIDQADAIKAELATMTKEQLLKEGGYSVQMRYRNEPKLAIVRAVYDSMIQDFALGQTVSYGMTSRNSYSEAVRRLVDATDAQKLADYAAERKAAIEEQEARFLAHLEGIKNPKTLDEFRAAITAQVREGKTRQEAYLSLTAEQRAKYDELEAESTRESREARKRAAKTEVRAAGQTTGGDIVATKHTRDGHDLWVVRLSDRLSTEDYKTVLASAKRLGGNYSSYRGNGALPGFQFRTPDAAQAFLKLAGGDTSAAKDMAEQRRDAFEDDRSQSAVERLREMADKLEERAQESLDRDRKTNTARRARFAASADREAQESKALAQTMRNIAQAIEDGRAKFLDGVRTKSQVELLRNRVTAAKQEELRSKYPSYADQEKRKGEPATAETADFAEFPAFTAFRSDLASLARQMLEVDGTKKLGQQLMSVADDVTDAYIEFAKKPENLHKLSTFSIRQGDDVKAAIFPSKDAAERAIRRSGLSDRAIVLAEKRGVNRIIMSPSEAMSRGAWTGDGDKRITLTRDAGSALVQAIGRRGSKANRLTVPWQFQTAHDRLNALQRIGIETPSEYRSALREFIGLQERAIVNKVREMELAMNGRKNDGLDFFPTPAEVADQMVAAADISPDMAVLEPSAGMGHIADRIREAGAEPDVIELAEDRRELLQEKGYHLVYGVRDFTMLEPRKFYTFGDIFRAPDGTEGIMHGGKGWSGRASLYAINDDGTEGKFIGWYDRDELTGVRHRGVDSGYDRIIMNPPFSSGRDIQHVMHAYDLLKPGGRIVAIMGESAFFNQSKKAQDFRQWLDEKGGTSEKLAEGSFMDSSLPVTTGVNARMVVIDKPESDGGTGFSRDSGQSEENALKALSENDDLFRLPKSDKTTVSEIAADNDPGISVKKLAGIPGRTEYQLTMPNGTTARLVVRPANPYGNNTYGFDYADGETSNVLDERPGENPQDVDPKKEDVWIDVSLLKPGQDGANVYNIASTYAHNTGRIFIGDPAGLSDDALIRRPEQMLSSALKFGTTEHIAPHPRQVSGDRKLGVPPLKWVYGDDIGNIKRLIDVNLKVAENAGLDEITFDPTDGSFRDSEGGDLGREGIQAIAVGAGYGRAAGAGPNTLARSAILRALLREEGGSGKGEVRGRDGLLARLVSVSAAHDEATKRVFYSREGVKTQGDAERASDEHVALVKSLVENITAKWKNSPDVVVLASFADAPAAVQRENERQVAGGASGEPGAFFYGGKAYLLASRMNSLEQVRRAVFHEVLGHLGLRGLYGAEMGSILDQLYKVRRSAIEKKALQYGLDLNEVRDRRMATEEYLADIAQSDPQLGFVRRALAAIRSWMRRNVPALAKMRMTDEELINEFILPVQQLIKEGPDGPSGKLSPAFMRNDVGMARAWHGSPHRGINKFSTDKVGTGEGAQAYGWGLYFASKREIAEHYRKGLSYRDIVRQFRDALPDNADTGEALQAAQNGELSKPMADVVKALAANDWLGFDYPSQAVTAAFKEIDNYEASQALRDAVRDYGGQLYGVEIPDDSEMLHWDKPMSQQPEKVQKAIEKLIASDAVDADTRRLWNSFGGEQASGKKLYELLNASDNLDNDGTGKAASLAMLEHGIKGIKYLDGGSRSQGDGSHNYVVFSGDHVEIRSTSFSRTSAAHEYADQARIAAKDFFGNAGIRVDWLDKSLKTQYAKADKFPAFGKVFNKVQDYIEGVSALANEAADKAPSILPKLDTFSDLWKSGILNHGLKPEDRKAVAAPVFDGTLEWSRVDGKLVRTDDLVEKAAKLTVDKKVRQMLRDGKVSQVELNNWMASKLDIYDAAVTNRYEREYLTPGVVFTDQELKDIYKLTPEQIGQYREFRASVDESLDQVAAAEIVRLVPNLPDDIVAMAQSPQGRAGLRDAVEGYLGDQSNDLWNQVQDKYLQTEKLKSRGYAPLSRFGKFFVHVVDENGQTQYFGLTETRYQSNKLARDLREEFGKSVQMEQGRISQEQYKLMAAVPLDAMEIFASAIGAEESEVFQKYLQLAKNNRSTMKRLIRRKGTAGFSQDVPRVLANFVTSNARAVSTNLHILDARKLVAEIKEGDIKDEAFNLVKAVTEPEESGAAIRGVMFANFIGGSIASAAVNVTQPVMMTLPYLSQWGGIAKAGKRLASAASMAMSKNAGDADLQAALKRAEHDGIVSPQEIHHLIQRAAGGLGERHPILQKMAFVWGAPFSLAEQFNRRTSFIAAYQTAREEGMEDPFSFAEKAVVETQGLYNAGNKPNAARGIAGATAMTFKQYSIHYLEWLARMAKSGKEGKKAAALALALLALAAGADGLPFMGDLDDVFDTIGQAMGYDTNTKRWRHKMAADVFGDELGDVMTRGVSATAGMPFDVSVRMSMSNLIPASDYFMKSNTDKKNSLYELAGPGGGLLKQYSDAVQYILNGELFEGAKKFAPVAAQNLAKGIEMATTGEYRDTRGRKVVDVGPMDAASKMLGFQPADVAKDSQRLSDVRQSESLARMTEAEITDAWARAIVEGDSAAERKALDMRDEWNEKNPEQRIVVKRSQAIKKARQLRMDRTDRYAKTVAPERRSAVKAELSN
jgi:hypothetical protein